MRNCLKEFAPELCAEMEYRMKFKIHVIRRIAATLLTVICLAGTVPAYALADEPGSPSAAPGTDFVWPTGPSVYADAAIVMEASTGLILYEKNIYDKFFPASITKIMTTLLALENCNLSETMTMSHEAEWDVDFDSSRIGLVEGEQVSLEDALYAVMLESANEVSYGVAEHVAKGPMSEFAKMMNARAAELGCVNTNFVNPHGLHDDNHYTCAYDMALISKAAIAIPEFRTITGTRTHQIPATNKNVLRYLANHHRFIRKTLNYEGTIGGKTGGTAEAKTTLVTFAERNGLTLIAVVLHVDTALHAYEDTEKILDFGFENYSLYNIEQTAETDPESFPSLFSKAPQFTRESVPHLRISENSNVVLPNSADIQSAEKSVVLTPVDEFVHGDNVIGQIAYTFAGKYVGFADIIYYNEGYPLTRAEFEARWPSYLIPPDITFEDVPPDKTISAAPDETITTVPAPSDEASKDLKGKKGFPVLPVILGVLAGIIVILAGLYIIFIEIPHRKRRKLYKERHKRRMDSLSSSNNFFE